MRVLSCKLQCLSICSSSKSSRSLQSPSPLKFEDIHRDVSSQSPISHAIEEQSKEEKDYESQKDESFEVKVEVFPKSSLKKPQASRSEVVEKERVKWMDFVGKELVEVREFEPIDSEEPEDEDGGNQTCVCCIQ